MNTAILKRLTVDQLIELKAATEKEINNRVDYSILPGRTGHFRSSGDATNPARNVYVTVVRINTKTVTCYENDNPKKRWKVSPEYLIMDGVRLEEEKVKTSSPAANYGVTEW